MAGSSVQETEETSLAGTQPRDLRLSAPFQVPIQHAAENAATTIGNPRTHGKGRQPDLETDLATLDRPPAASMGGNNFVTMRGPVMAMALSARPVVSLTPFASMRPVVDIDRLASVRGAALAFHHAPAYDSMRGPVLVLDDAPLSPTSALHPSTSETSAMPTSSDVLPTSLMLPRGTFSLRGELMHAFVSYRVATEGPEGNGLSDLLAEKIRALSMDSTQQLQIPRHGWGLWPEGAKQAVPFRKEEAKVFLDRDCLQDGQSWLAGFVKALAASMVVVPLLSWTEEDAGSLGEMSRIGVQGFDRVDNVLLELILATALREEPAAAVQAVLPLLIGPARTAAEGGGFGAFPFHKLAGLSDEPSRATNAQAGAILRHLGLSEVKVQAVLGRSVKQVVGLVLRNQGVQASQWEGVEGVVAECGTRALKTVLQEMRRLRSDPKYFEQGRPMGSEVLEWLQVENLRSYAPLFIHHDLDSLAYVARLKPEGIHQIFDEHQELYPRSGKKGALGGELQKLETAHRKLLHTTPPRCHGLVGPRPDERTLPLSERLENYRDTEARALAIVASGNGLELMHSKAVPRWGWVVSWTAISLALFFWPREPGMESSFQREFGRGYMSILVGMTGLLPLVSRTGRMFVHLLQWWVPVYLCGLWFAVYGYEAATTGRWATAGFWGPFVLVNIVLLWFRERHFLSRFFITACLAFAVVPVVSCVHFDTIAAAGYETYSQCAKTTYQASANILVGAFSACLLLIGRKFANDAWAFRAARASRELHRALWQRELSKVAANPEVMDGLRRLPHGIAQELQEQRRQAVRSLGVVGRVTAFLNERVGCWSLRGYRSKARQVHGDIDLLFDEATMVNEPFLDLMSSLVAGPSGSDGRGGRVRRRSVVREGSEEFSGETAAFARPGLALKRGPIKKPNRALQKLVRVYGRDVAMLTDLVRCTVLAEDLSQVEALITTLDARSVVGLAAVAARGEEGDEVVLVLDNSDDERIFRITAIKNRFDESYDDNKSGGYRDLSLSVEVGWVMRDGLVSFERVRDWEALECQRHICEIQVHLRSQHHQIVNEGLHSRYVELRNKYNR